jgi:hypothetical protein
MWLMGGMWGVYLHRDPQRRSFLAVLLCVGGTLDQFAALQLLDAFACPFLSEELAVVQEGGEIVV